MRSCACKAVFRPFFFYVVKTSFACTCHTLQTGLEVFGEVTAIIILCEARSSVVRASYQYLEGSGFDSNWELTFSSKHFFVVPNIYFYSVDSSYLDGRLASIVRKSVR